jgi:hypothetical protein
MRKSHPRLHASLILLLTGLAGFLASFVLLRLGIDAMWLRYPVAILFAYGVFLILLRVWLSLSRPRDFGLDIVDTTVEVVSEVSADPGFGGGADFAGAGAGGVWQESVSSVTSTRSVSTIASTNSSGSGGSIFNFDIDLDDAWIIIPVVLLLAAGVIAALYVVYIAPALLAEILLDGVLMAGLYKRVKSIEHQHWLRSAFRQTVVPAIVVVVFFTVAGLAMQMAAPDARSIGEFWEHVTR